MERAPQRWRAQRPVARRTTAQPTTPASTAAAAAATTAIPAAPVPVHGHNSSDYRPTGRLLRKWRLHDTDVIVLVSRNGLYAEFPHPIAIFPLACIGADDLALLRESAQARERLYTLASSLGLLHTDGECCARDAEEMHRHREQLEWWMQRWTTAAASSPSGATLLAATQRWRAALRIDVACCRLSSLAGLRLEVVWELP